MFFSFFSFFSFFFGVVSIWRRTTAVPIFVVAGETFLFNVEPINSAYAESYAPTCWYISTPIIQDRTDTRVRRRLRRAAQMYNTSFQTEALYVYVYCVSYLHFFRGAGRNQRREPLPERVENPGRVDDVAFLHLRRLIFSDENRRRPTTVGGGDK